MWDLQSFIANGGRYIEYWVVAENYRSGLMEQGDRALLWVSGPTTGAMPRGIWAFGHVTGHVYAEAESVFDRPGAGDDNSRIDDDEISYWLDKKQESRARFFVPVKLEILREPVPADNLTSIGLRDLEVIRQPQMSNPSYVTPEQFALLAPLLPAWPERSLPADEEIIVGPSGAGFGDPVTNQMVEVAAMRYVEQQYVSLGWEIDDVSSKKVGWDLTCSSPDGDVIHLEVEGASGWRPVVLLTANEIRAANEDSIWNLAVVTRSSSHPELTLINAATALTAAQPYVYRADFG